MPAAWAIVRKGYLNPQLGEPWAPVDERHIEDRPDLARERMDQVAKRVTTRLLLCLGTQGGELLGHLRARNLEPLPVDPGERSFKKAGVGIPFEHSLRCKLEPAQTDGLQVGLGRDASPLKQFEVGENADCGDQRPPATLLFAHVLRISGPHAWVGKCRRTSPGMPRAVGSRIAKRVLHGGAPSEDPAASPHDNRS